MADTTMSCGLPGKDDPQGNFEGDVRVTDDIPKKKALEQCAELPVLDSSGKARTFKSLYAGDGATQRHLIIFVRHFFCGICQDYLRAVSASIKHDELAALSKPTSITVIGCGQPELIEMYIAMTDCTFPIFAGPTPKLYDVLEMTRTLDMGNKKPDYMQLGVIGNAVRSIFQGMRAGRDALKSGDLKQVGGEFLFENGEVVWCHRMRNTRDHAEVAEIRKILSMDGAELPSRKTWSNGIKVLAKRSSSWGRPSKEGSEKRNSEEEKATKDTEKLSVEEAAKKPDQVSKENPSADHDDSVPDKASPPIVSDTPIAATPANIPKSDAQQSVEAPAPKA